MFEEDSSTIVKGQHHYRPGVANHIAPGANAARFFDFIGRNMKYRALECNSG